MGYQQQQQQQYLYPYDYHFGDSTDLVHLKRSLNLVQTRKKDKDRYVLNYDGDREEMEQLLSFLYDNGYMPKTWVQWVIIVFKT